MSGMAYPKSQNPFDDDADDEDFKPKRQGFDDDEDEDSTLSEAERRQQRLQQEVMRTAQSAVDSSYRSLGLIYESEKMGVETAEELMRQGEAIKRTDKMLDNIDQNMNISQRHITSIKSVWGGIVNYFKKTPETKPPPLQSAPTKRLQSAMSSSKSNEDKYQASHPNLRKLDTGGKSFSSRQNGYSQNRHLQEAHLTLDKNLDDMSDGLSRLKNLGLGLQSEIDDQDDSIDSLMNKVDKMDVKISKTNQQMKNLK
uniref:Synaptosomal-associated protein 29 n=1 Tax=Gouania willdenowi TaxID=441366 RepID=A0A8C5GKP1_GOUWI